MRLSTYFVAPGNKFLLTERKEKDKKIIFMHLKETDVFARNSLFNYYYYVTGGNQCTILQSKSLKKARLQCHQEVSRCCTRGESDKAIVYRTDPSWLWD